jgi:hypothetical protein
MAAIDKIYGKKVQYDEFRAWCEKNKPDALKHFYPREYWDSIEWQDGKEHPITNFPENIDMWMLKNCPIKWVTDYIGDQYGEG